MEDKHPLARGRGSQANPPNRFGGPFHVLDLEQVEHDEEYLASLRNLPTEYLPDRARTIVTENASPDVGFRYSLNPYRGCSHGCTYCYARPTHEWLGLNAGLDFETKIFVKDDAPALFRAFLSRPGWTAEPIVLSGNTDCYQPAERQFHLTRRLLEIAAEALQPIALITKNALVLRDLDLIAPMAAACVLQANVTLTTLDAELARSMEPRTSTPAARLRTIEALSAAGVPVRVFLAPIIPGLTDAEIPSLLASARSAGARDAAYTLLRLPLTVAPVFFEWLDRAYPGRRSRIEGRIRSARSGGLNSAAFGRRMVRTGALAEGIRSLFRVLARKHGLDGGLPPLDASRFRPPRPTSGQLRLF